MIKRIFFFIVVVGVIGGVMALNQVRHVWIKAAPEDAAPVSFVVAEGQSSSSITNALFDADLIANRFWFKMYLRLAGYSGDLKPGTYVMRQGEGYSTIAGRLLYGNQGEVQLTIPEGFSLAQMEERITEAFNITGAEWRLATGVESPLEDHPFVVAAQKPDGVDLEGYLFPETYRFFSNATAEVIATRMVDEMAARIEEEKVEAAEGMTMHETLTLASVVQKEVRGESDMRRVAGIFTNRLDIGMALQSDATVNYFTKKGMPSPTFVDITIEHPYNTYTNTGLPPGPIASAGIVAIKAVADPEQHDYLYFLTSPEGKAYYGKTLEEHVANRVYLK